MLLSNPEHGQRGTQSVRSFLAWVISEILTNQPDHVPLYVLQRCDLERSMKIAESARDEGEADTREDVEDGGLLCHVNPLLSSEDASFRSSSQVISTAVDLMSCLMLDSHQDSQAGPVRGKEICRQRFPAQTCTKFREKRRLKREEGLPVFFNGFTTLALFEEKRSVDSASLLRPAPNSGKSAVSNARRGCRSFSMGLQRFQDDTDFEATSAATSAQSAKREEDRKSQWKKGLDMFYKFSDFSTPKEPNLLADFKLYINVDLLGVVDDWEEETDPSLQNVDPLLLGYRNGFNQVENTSQSSRPSSSLKRRISEELLIEGRLKQVKTQKSDKACVPDRGIPLSSQPLVSREESKVVDYSSLSGLVGNAQKAQRTKNRRDARRASA
ncbi:hypothetical protein K435DRAFT_862256 [Dendrothele bispora CBS 962.96]|uniref:Uncharacterized protein n=1 Tax=Dendrothele bispora (strain CBS 962.96) TaxID=1314807 RepID=A0A4S8LT18_DENBC|nr:hypothetical protein K435DRAFT_862256 [Dendrothele bispora CBS 962.96]